MSKGGIKVVDCLAINKKCNSLKEYKQFTKSVKFHRLKTITVNRLKIRKLNDCVSSSTVCLTYRSEKGVTQTAEQTNSDLCKRLEIVVVVSKGMTKI